MALGVRGLCKLLHVDKIKSERNTSTCGTLTDTSYQIGTVTVIFTVTLGS